jgi:nicotinamidase-related amidase
MKMKPRRVSNSALIDPAVSCLILIAPKEQDLSRLSPRAKVDTRRRLWALAEAADVMDVPVLLVLPDPGQRIHSLMAHVPRMASHHQFWIGEDEVPWCNAAFVERLDHLNSSVLVIAGYWIEHEILTTALNARHDMYYAYVPVDASPARTEMEAALTRERLLQAGATPVLTSQVLREWRLDAPDSAKKAAISSALAPIA